MSEILSRSGHHTCCI